MKDCGEHSLVYNCKSIRLKRNLTLPGNVVSADLHWFNSSPCCSEAHVTWTLLGVGTVHVITPKSAGCGKTGHRFEILKWWHQDGPFQSGSKLFFNIFRRILPKSLLLLRHSSPSMLASVWLMCCVSSVTQGELWLGMDLCAGASGRQRVRGQIYWKFKSLINPTALRACSLLLAGLWNRPWFGHTAAACVLSSAVSRFCCCGGACIIEPLPSSSTVPLRPFEIKQ